MLASLPVRLVPGEAPEEQEPGWSTVRLSLLIAWSCLALAAVAVGLVLHGALALSERRGTFVSAVTHELRTPLTTFRLYTEMLDEGMVTNADSQRSYLKTLRAEANRLGHLVENVLAFARLERGYASAGRETLPFAEILERLVPRLAARAEQAGMELVVGSENCDACLRMDLSVVDQILSNLVDNAIKYAASASDRRVHLNASLAGRWLVMTVRDHGPGLRALGSFAACSGYFPSRHRTPLNPRLGLGSAWPWSRRLARSLGGILRLLENGPRGRVLRAHDSLRVIPGLRLGSCGSLPSRPEGASTLPAQGNALGLEEPPVI